MNVTKRCMGENVMAKEIVTIDQDPHSCLGRLADKIVLTEEGMVEASKIAIQLREALLPLMPAAGLAAPQICVSKQMFIFSWDRSIDNLEVVINPVFEPVTDEIEESWEACFSTVQDNGRCQAAFIPRHLNIHVSYMNLEGQPKKKRLEGFAAKVFQHEYDHLQGIVCVSKAKAEVKTFATKAEFIEFMTNVKQADSAKYHKPIEL